MATVPIIRYQQPSATELASLLASGAAVIGLEKPVEDEKASPLNGASADGAGGQHHPDASSNDDRDLAESSADVDADADDGSGVGSVVDKKKRAELLMLDQQYQEDQLSFRYTEATNENIARRWEARELRISLAKHVQVQTQIIEQLRVTLAAKHSTVTRLCEETRAQHAALEKDRIDFQREHEEMILAHNEEKQMIHSDISSYRQRNEEISRYVVEKQALADQLVQYRSALTAEAKALEVRLAEMAVRHRAEKDAMKNAMVNKVKETKLALLEMTQDQLDDTTKRTIAENDKTCTELHYQSAIHSRLKRANVGTALRCQLLSDRLDVLRTEQQRGAGRVHLLRSLLETIKAKTAELGASIAAHNNGQTSDVVFQSIANGDGGFGGAVSARATPSSIRDGGPVTQRSSSHLSQAGLASLRSGPSSFADGPASSRSTAIPSSGLSSVSSSSSSSSSSSTHLSIRGLQSRLDQLTEQLRLAHHDRLVAEEHAARALRNSRDALAHLDPSARFILASLGESCKQLRRADAARAVTAAVAEVSECLQLVTPLPSSLKAGPGSGLVVGAASVESSKGKGKGSSSGGAGGADIAKDALDMLGFGRGGSTKGSAAPPAFVEDFINTSLNHDMSIPLKDLERAMPPQPPASSSTSSSSSSSTSAASSSKLVLGRSGVAPQQGSESGWPVHSIVLAAAPNPEKQVELLDLWFARMASQSTYSPEAVDDIVNVDVPVHMFPDPLPPRATSPPSSSSSSSSSSMSPSSSSSLSMQHTSSSGVVSAIPSPFLFSQQQQEQQQQQMLSGTGASIPPLPSVPSSSSPSSFSTSASALSSLS